MNTSTISAFSWEAVYTDNRHLVGRPIEVKEETHLYLRGTRAEVLVLGMQLQKLLGPGVEVHCFYEEQA